MKTKTTHLPGLLAGSLLLANSVSATVLTAAYYRMGENDPGAANGDPANPVTQGYLTNYPDLYASGTGATYSTNTGVMGSTLCVNMKNSAGAAAVGNQWGIEAWTNRIFGATILATNFNVVSSQQLQSAAGTNLLVSVYPYTTQASSKTAADQVEHQELSIQADSSTT